MNDKLGFSIGTKVDPYTSLKPLPDLVAVDLCKAYPVLDGSLLLVNTTNGKRCMVQTEVFTMLQECLEFRTIEQHTARIMERNPEVKEQKAEINQVLQHMLASGMLISAKATCERLGKTAPEAQETDNRPVVAIITCDRPDLLERLLESIKKNCQAEDVYHFYVIDDSRTEKSIEQNQQLVARFTTGIGASLTYFGRAEQDQLIEGLIKRLPQHEKAIRFLVDTNRWQSHWTAGLSRNLALLLSCGQRLIMLDDDAVCEAHDAPNATPKVSFSNLARDADFFASESEWAHLKQPLNPDPIKRHMQCLGMTFSQAVRVLGLTNLNPAGFQGATALEVNALKPSSPILVTECGSLGYPGTGTNTWLPDMSPGSLARMLKSERKTTNALTTRKVWRGRDHPHFSSRACMSQITGFDNRQILPPYLPIMRNQNQLFGNILNFIHPSAITLDYPWAVPHQPIPERRWRESDLSFKPGGSFQRFFFEGVLAAKESCVSGSADDRIAFLSSWFKDLASAPGNELVEMYRQERLASDVATLGRLNKLIKQAQSTPVNWQNYLRNGIRQLNTDLDITSRGDMEVTGYPQGVKGDELIAFWKDTWNGYADALMAWTDIRDAAKAHFYP